MHQILMKTTVILMRKMESMFTFLLFMLLLESAALQCSIEGKKCCVGSWNDIQNKCEDGCQPGYFGKSCTHKCQYPNYGNLCQQKCNCPVSSFHYRDGCSREKESGRKCTPGYHGKNCSTPCRYPSFGELCQEFCECSSEMLTTSLDVQKERAVDLDILELAEPTSVDIQILANIAKQDAFAPKTNVITFLGV
ncbi:cell death abnormality protein 1-like [Saccostrea cucullata]|uniref:cell death abnormality protein 1-like n=1 Tax=Saccostrea cuccullata TaxID=36930 RepID=UPI002ED374B5